MKINAGLNRAYFTIFLTSLIAGCLAVFSYSPYNYPAIIFFSLGIVFYFWQKLSAKQAAVSAWFFGLGLQGFGISWLYYSLHVHGNAHIFFAIFLIFLMSSILGLYYASSAYLVNRYLPKSTVFRLTIFYPLSWLFFELLQGYLFTGLAWMQYGYTQIDTPLAGFAPIIGSHGVGALVAFSAGVFALCLVYFQQYFTNSTSNNKVSRVQLSLALVMLIFTWITASYLNKISWTQKAGNSIRVAVVQGNIAQQDKWKPAMKKTTMERYKKLTLAQKDADLIIWPETAVPGYWFDVAPYTRQLRTELAKNNTDLLLGIFIQDEKQHFLNSALSINGGVYSKRHLVPLGEYIPFRFLIEFFNQFVDIPMSDLVAGSDKQALIKVAGVAVNLSICFEEVFSRNIIRDLPEAKLLINLTNDAWFDDSAQPHQHHAIARMRARETERYMIHSTNTGITSLINAKGKVIKQLPQFEIGVLTGEVQPLKGATPFVQLGNGLLALITAAFLLVIALFNQRFIK